MDPLAVKKNSQVSTQVVGNDCLPHRKGQETSVATFKFGPKAFCLALLKMSCGFVDYGLSGVSNIKNSMKKQKMSPL